MIETIIPPIVKNKCGNISDGNNTLSFILIFLPRVYKRTICNMINYSSFSDFRLGGLMRAIDIPVLLRSPWLKASNKIATQIQCDLMSHAAKLLFIIVY